MLGMLLAVVHKGEIIHIRFESRNFTRRKQKKFFLLCQAMRTHENETLADCI